MANTIDWGQGAVNNTIDWGKGKTNNTINWAEIYDSTPAGETNITGSGGVAPFVNTYSMSLDGIDEYFDLGDLSSGLSSKTSATVSLWFKRDTTTNEFLFDLKEGTSRIGMQLYFGTSIYFYLNNKYYLHPTATAINNWYNLIFVFNGNGATNQDKLKMYLNGTELTGGTYSGTIDTAIGVFTSLMTSNIGRTPSTAYFSGNIDEVAIWNSDQNANVSTIYNSGTPTDLTSLSPLSWWRMGDGDTWNGSIWTLTDNGSGGNNATSVFMEEADRVTDVP